MIELFIIFEEGYCPFCGSPSMVKMGRDPVFPGIVYQCYDCGYIAREWQIVQFERNFDEQKEIRESEAIEA